MNKKNALVTGASHGIGKAIAIALAKNGYRVGINYCNNEAGALDTLRQVEEAGSEGIILQGDVGNHEALSNVFETYFAKFSPTIDLLVNNAGITRFYDLLEVTEAQWQQITNTDWKSTFFGTQLAARNMVKNGIHGVIVNIASNHVDGCLPNAATYAATKAAVTRFSESAAMELAKYGIRVLSMAPGYTQVWPDDHPIKEVTKRIPLGRFAQPEEVANILVFLASETCGYMTGTRVTIDGGAMLPVLTENMYIEECYPPEE